MSTTGGRGGASAASARASASLLSRAARERREAEARAEAALAPLRPPVVLTPLAEAVAPVRLRFRPLISELCQWALAQGHRLEPDTVALLLAAADEGHGVITKTQWTRTGVQQFLWADTFNWCGIRRVLTPDGVPETLWWYLQFLVATDRLDYESDPLPELCKPLMCYGGLDEHGKRRSDGTRSPVPCQCYVTYRGPSHGETVSAGRPDIGQPVHVIESVQE